MFSFTWNVLFLKVMLDPSTICSQNPHLCSLHRVTFAGVFDSLNTDFVNMRFRFGSCHLHLTILVSLNIFDMVSSVFRISMLFLIIPNTSLFFGLCVEIKGNISSVSLLFTSRSLALGIDIAFLIPALMILVGYFLCVSV